MAASFILCPFLLLLLLLLLFDRRFLCSPFYSCSEYHITSILHVTVKFFFLSPSPSQPRCFFPERISFLLWTSFLLCCVFFLSCSLFDKQFLQNFPSTRETWNQRLLKYDVLLSINIKYFVVFSFFFLQVSLTLILLTWRIWWGPNNDSKWQMGFNSSFKGLICCFMVTHYG